MIYITAEDAAKLLKTTRQTVHRWMNDGTLPRYGIGRIVRTTLEDVAFAMKPINHHQTKERFLDTARSLYESYLLLYPKERKERRILELVLHFNEYAERRGLE